MNLLHWAMNAVQYRRTAPAIKTASKVGTFFIVVLFAVDMAAVGAIWSKQLPDGGVQWLPEQPWACYIGQCASYCTGALQWQSKWPADEVLCLSSSVLSSTITVAITCNSQYKLTPQHIINIHYDYSIRILWAAAEDKGHRFGHHCCQRASSNSIKLEASIYKLIST